MQQKLCQKLIRNVQLDWGNKMSEPTVLEIAQATKNFLSDPVYKDAAESVEEALTELWKIEQCPIKREALWHRLRGLQELQAYFQVALDNGAYETALRDVSVSKRV